MNLLKAVPQLNKMLTQLNRIPTILNKMLTQLNRMLTKAPIPIPVTYVKEDLLSRAH